MSNKIAHTQYQVVYWATRYKIALSVIGFLLLAFMYSFGLNNNIFPPDYDDSARYINLAQSIANDFRFMYSYRFASGRVNLYPLAYPAFLAPLVRFFPGTFFILKLLTVFFGLLFIVVFSYLCKKICNDALWPAVFALTVANPLLLLYSRQILSEIPYLFFSFLSLYYMVLYAKSRFVLNKNLIFFSVLVFLTCNIRYFGVVVFFASFVYLLIRRYLGKAAVLVLLSLLFICTWLYFNVYIGTSSYIAVFSSATKGVGGFAHRYFYNLFATIGKELPDFFLYPFFLSIEPRSSIFFVKFILGSFLAILLSVGFFVKVRKIGLDLFDLYSISYFFVIYLSWTAHGARFLLPLLPFLAWYLLKGIQAFCHGKRVFYFLVIALLLINCAGSIKELLHEMRSPYTPEEESFMEAARWIKGNVRVGDIVVSRKPAWLSVYDRGRPGVKYLVTLDTEKQLSYLRENRAAYFVVDHIKIFTRDAGDYLLPLVRLYPGSFEKVYETAKKPSVAIYKILP